MNQNNYPLLYLTVLDSKLFNMKYLDLYNLNQHIASRCTHDEEFQSINRTLICRSIMLQVQKYIWDNKIPYNAADCIQHILQTFKPFLDNTFIEHLQEILKIKK